MKNYLILAVLSYLLFNGQFNTNLTAQIGSRIALNYSYFSFSKELKENNNRTNTPNLGFEIGLFTTLKLSDKIEIDPFFNFTKYGNTIDLNDGYSGEHSFYNLHFSILPKYIVSINNKKKFSIFMGPNIGLGLGRPMFNFCTPSGCETIESSYSGKDEYDYKLWNFGGILGFEYYLVQKVKIDIRYLKYFSNLYNLADLYKTNTISIGVSYKYF